MHSDDAGRTSDRAQDDTPGRDELQQSLARVHAALAATPHVEQRSRALLQEVLADIERLLPERPAPAAARPDAAADPIAAPQGAAGNAAAARAPERLEELAVEFENHHPLLAATVRQFIELLARAGL